MPTKVETGGRVHAGFLNLSLTRHRIYGGLGFALAEPTLSVTVRRASTLECSNQVAEKFAKRSLAYLGIPGASIDVESELPRHAGLGSGTQLALSVCAGIAREYDLHIDPRVAAPALDRGGRSGIGVAVFEDGGFVIDAGHPTEHFTTDRPPRGEWSVPPISARHDIPSDWRILLVRADVPPGRSGEQEDESMRAIVESADPTLSDEIASVVTGRLLPALAVGDHVAFGSAVAEVGRLNGAWYASEQGGLYRPPVGPIIDELEDSSAITGAGQSSWGPTVYGVTSVKEGEPARKAGKRALQQAGLDGSVAVVRPRNKGASIRQV